VEKLQADAKKAQDVFDEYVKAESKVPGGAEEEESLLSVEARLEKLERDVGGAAKKVTSVETDWRTVVRDFPGIDFLAPTFKIEKVVLADLHEDLNFETVPRIDRCKTCHINIDNPDARTVGFQSKEWGSVYANHPRLDLFVGSSSPHPYESFGCTTCHYGDGHSTDFITAAHTPEDEEEAKRWKKKYGWSELHHQDYPMLQRKYVTSSCMKCHPSEHKLEGGGSYNLGYEIVKTYGCYGCHRMKIFEGFEKVGPSLAHVSDKLDIGFLYKWIRNPHGFRSSTRMPQFFDLTNSKGRMGVLRGDTNEIHELDFDVRNGVETLAIATYLHETSDRRSDIQKLTVKGDTARKRNTFRQSGCLSCHSVKQKSMAAPGESGAAHDSVLARGGIDALDAFLPKAVEEASKAAAAAVHAADASARASADAALRAASA